MGAYAGFCAMDSARPRVKVGAANIGIGFGDVTTVTSGGFEGVKVGAGGPVYAEKEEFQGRIVVVEGVGMVDMVGMLGMVGIGAMVGKGMQGEEVVMVVAVGRDCRGLACWCGGHWVATARAPAVGRTRATVLEGGNVKWVTYICPARADWGGGGILLARDRPP
jgi:hypothetical protein